VPRNEVDLPQHGFKLFHGHLKKISLTRLQGVGDVWFIHDIVYYESVTGKAGYMSVFDQLKGSVSRKLTRVKSGINQKFFL
jgi:hypothetical protein